MKVQSLPVHLGCSVEDTWLLCHQRYLKETAEVDKHGGWDVLFYGDSIIEEWR